MTRDPRRDVADVLRVEVGFRCPVENCHCPFLSFHHFDPPWREEEHHRPEGMIALCVQHAAMGDAGHFSKQQLRELKNASRDPEFSYPLPWRPESITFMLGNIALVGARATLSLRGMCLLNGKRMSLPGSAEHAIGFDGSFVDPLGRTILRIEDNMMSFATQDLQSLRATARAKEIGLRHKSGVSMNIRIDYPRTREFKKRMIHVHNLPKPLIRDLTDLAVQHAQDSEGRLPLVSLTGQFKVPEVEVHATERHVRVNMAGYGPVADMGGRIIGPAGSIQAIDDPSGNEIFSFGKGPSALSSG